MSTMYSREKRLQAVELYILYERSAAAVIHELGYPDPRMLAKWYKAHLEEQETGIIKELNSSYIRYGSSTLCRTVFIRSVA